MLKQCPHGYTFRDKATCARRTTLSREIICPEGFALQGQSCVAINYIPPRPICPEGSTETELGQCLVQESFKASKLCPESYLYDNELDVCLEELSAEGIPSCSVGFYDEIQDSCVVAELLPPIIGCPPNAKRILSGNDHSLCEQIEKKRPKISCPPEFSLSEQGESMCLGRALADGELKCQDPYQDSGEKCTYLEILPKIMGCIDGGYLKGTSCISPSSQPPIVMCPEGYTYSQDSQLCKKRLVSKPTPICPKAYVYDNLVRKCYKFGTEQSHENRQEHPTQMPEQKLLPLEVQPANTATTTPKPKVKAKISQPGAGKQQFIPIQTFTGAQALQQASQMEALKLQNQAAGASPPQQVLTPPVPTAH